MDILVIKHKFKKNSNGFDIIPGKPSRKSCVLPPSIGDGLYAIPRYYFNAVTNKCERFFYSGKDGNDNRFYEKDKCERLCLGRQAIKKMNTMAVKILPKTAMRLEETTPPFPTLIYVPTTTTLPTNLSEIRYQKFHFNASEKHTTSTNLNTDRIFSNLMAFTEIPKTYSTDYFGLTPLPSSQISEDFQNLSSLTVSNMKNGTLIPQLQNGSFDSKPNSSFVPNTAITLISNTSTRLPGIIQKPDLYITKVIPLAVTQSFIKFPAELAAQQISEIPQTINVQKNNQQLFTGKTSAHSKILPSNLHITVISERNSSVSQSILTTNFYEAQTPIPRQQNIGIQSTIRSQHHMAVLFSIISFYEKLTSDEKKNISDSRDY
uniref:BPTI/Kunitz inhibitor domain-containing protein n=1 Tax=Heterorhabditis bacteriophora TaxID=37862 RepID=A0A1I7XNH8_HETBA